MDIAGADQGTAGFPGGKVALERRACGPATAASGRCPSWEAAMARIGWASGPLNLMLINVSTRKFGRAVRLPEAMFQPRTARAVQNQPPRAGS